MKLLSQKISNTFSFDNIASLYEGSCIDFLRTIPNSSIQLIVTSPPYNIGKEYEHRLKLNDYEEQQKVIITECYRILKNSGSICWQVGNYVKSSEILPLDILLHPVFASLGFKLRNRIIWHFEHGLHCSKRFSGRYETIMWYTKTNEYTFNLDNVRVPQKYPSKKYFKGPKIGQFSCNPLGKNPGDLWIIPNVKNNHVEKTNHPCQFPVELIERLILSLTNEKDIVLDPFVGVGSSIIAAVIHNRIGMGSEIVPEYTQIAKERISLAIDGRLKIRPMNLPVYDPSNLTSKKNNANSTIDIQHSLFDHEKKRKVN
jgi:adenine-specific DNA-methyltransferase